MTGKFIATLLLVSSFLIGGAAYDKYWWYKSETNSARFYRTHPNEVPMYMGSQSREQYIAGLLISADRSRNQAILRGAGSLLFLIGGVALFIRDSRKKRITPAPEGGLSENPTQRFEAMSRWASVALARPIKIHFKRSYSILFASVIVFFIGISLFVIVVNGFTTTSVLILILNVIMLFTLYYMVSRAQRKSASLFDSSGVTRRDGQRFSWSEFNGVDYVMAIRRRSGEEYLWRIELAFSSDNAWITPQRIENLDEINNFVERLPGTHQKRTI